MRRFKGECEHFRFNKCPIYTHDSTSAKFSTNSQEMDNSVGVGWVTQFSQKWILLELNKNPFLRCSFKNFLFLSRKFEFLLVTCLFKKKLSLRCHIPHPHKRQGLEASISTPKRDHIWECQFPPTAVCILPKPEIKIPCVLLPESMYNV
jgi:hypothetical protein